VRIGRVYPPYGREVEFGMFQQWIKAALALNEPKEITSVKDGDLFSYKEDSGKIFLRGLYLCSKHTKHGYNFANGEVNREREQLLDGSQEQAAFATIWAGAIQKKPQLVKEYVKMLWEKETEKWIDVEEAEDYISEQTSVAIWKYLREVANQDGQFYCNQEFADKVPSSPNASVRLM
jgi:hypothetical protein